MFCKNCGKEIEDGTKFCPKCGAACDAAKGQDGASVDEIANKTLDSVSDTIEKTNPLCIAGLVLTVLMFFVNYCGLVGFAALVLSFFGYKAARKNGQKGTMIAIICMAVAGITSLIFVIRLIEYNRYESAVYGELNGLLDWLGDLF